jgi:hypothetical protein
MLSLGAVSGCGSVVSRSIDALSFEGSFDVNDANKPPANGLKRLEEKLSVAASPGTFPKYVRANFERLARIVEDAGRQVGADRSVGG